MPSSPSQNPDEPRGFVYILLAGFAFLAGVFSSRHGSKYPQEHMDTRHASHETERQGGQQNIRGNVAISYAEKVVQCHRAESNEQQRIQNSIRKATWATFIAASIYAGISLAIWCEMQHQTRIQRQVSVSSERPWITITITLEEPLHAHSASPGLTFNGDGTASLNAFIVVKNVGHSIAKFIYVRPQMYPPVFDRLLTEPIVKQASWCENVRKETPIDLQLPSLFPGEESIENFTIGMSKQDIAAAVKDVAFAKINAIVPVIYGCVNYKSDVFDGIHQTPFLYQLIPIRVAPGTIPGAQLELMKLFKGMGAD
jgi:hypothetical protein